MIKMHVLLKFSGILAYVLAGLQAMPQQVMPYKDSLLPIEIRVNDLLGRMTKEEKFWQLFMLSESWELPKDRYSKGIFGFEGGEAEGKAQGQMISITSGGSSVDLVKRINAAQRFFLDKTRLGIPIIPFGEALHGLIRDGGTSFPQSIGLAATFDTSLMHRISAAIAEQTRNCGIRMVLSPVVNIADDPRWGRTEETYGEDPWLASVMGIAFVSEFEKAGIITDPKHFVANDGQGGHDSYPVHFTERLLEEIYFPPFKACIQQGGSRSVMAAYNSLDGTPCTSNGWLLNKKLKKEWAFDGFIISDAGATGGSNCLHMTAKDYYESTVLAMNNGLDVIFQTDYDHYKLFQPPFLDGSIKQAAIDQAVTRVLRAKFQLGLFDQPIADTSKAVNCFGKPEHLTLAREAAQKSIILLKNEHNILPLSKSIKSIAVIGQDAMEVRLGGYSGTGYKKISIVEGIRQLMEGRRQKAEGISKGISKDISEDIGVVQFAEGCGRSSKEYSVVPKEFLSTTANDKGLEGLSGQYFNNTALEGPPILTRRDPAIDFRWTLYSPDPMINYDWFSVRWTGFITFPESYDCAIGIEGNDGYRLFIDSIMLIDNWVKGSYKSTLKDFHFEKGKSYPIRIEFFETSGSVRFKLVWKKNEEPQWKKAIAQALVTANKCDAIVVVAGIEEGEGLDRAFLSLPGHQEEMILQLAALKKPMVVVLTGGSAITMNQWLDKVDGILDCWYPGEQGGNAVADVLFGDVNPAGRLPITFPMTEGQLPLTYNHKPTGRNDDYHDISGEALFPFGYGLSYTTFEYSDLRLGQLQLRKGDSTFVKMKIRNMGKIAGDEVVQLYIKDLYASVARPMKELKGFQRIHLAPGESREVSFVITPEMLSMLDINLKRTVEPGDFRILIGASSKDIRLRGMLTVKPQ